MTTSAFWAYGSQLQMGDGATPEVFTAISEVIDIAGPTRSRDSMEASSNSSVSGYREFVPGWRDGGEVTFNCNWLPTDATHDETTGLLESFNDDDLHNWRLVLPDAVKTIAFAGFITSFDPDLSMEKLGGLAITIKISGKPSSS